MEACEGIPEADGAVLSAGEAVAAVGVESHRQHSAFMGPLQHLWREEKNRITPPHHTPPPTPTPHCTEIDPKSQEGEDMPTTLHPTLPLRTDKQEEASQPYKDRPPERSAPRTHDAHGTHLKLLQGLAGSLWGACTAPFRHSLASPRPGAASGGSNRALKPPLRGLSKSNRFKALFGPFSHLHSLSPPQL